MVQRKVSSKFGIQADEVKTNNLLVNLKPSSLHHQDAKNKGADLKKKIKKSRPNKRSDLDRLGTPNMRRQVPQPGKPPPAPPPVFSTTSASPQKKSPVKTSETTPNYMKATTSSDARKERSQVSFRNLQALFDSKSSNRKESNCVKISSGSVHKATRVLARTSSLKLVRTLTKTTSFKPARPSAKKCSPLVLSENLDVQRATCSSTLKESKFPAYLELSSGATEAEGISVMKVCPYTYCSLNGHHHPPLPPLKSFMSARRRMLKTQRSFKLGCLSPRRPKPVSSSMEDIQVEQKNFDEKSPDQPWNSSISSPVIQEEHTNFFVQIYSNGRPAGDETLAQVDNRQVHEIFSDESPCSEIDSHYDGSVISDAVSSDMVAAEYSQEVDQNIEQEEVYYHFQAEEKSKMGSLSWSDKEFESRAIIPTDNPEFGPSGMDCEAEACSTINLDYEVDNLVQSGQEFDLEGDSVEFGSYIIPEESILKSDSVSRCFEEIQTGLVLQQSSHEESFDNESLSSKAGSYHGYQIEDYVEGLDNESDDQLGLQVEDKPVKPIKTEDNNAAESFHDFHDMTGLSSKEESNGSTSIGSRDEIEDYQSDANSNISSFNCQTFNGSMSPDGKDSESEKNTFKIELSAEPGDGMEEKEQVDPVKAMIRIEICLSLQGSAEATKDKPMEDYDDNPLEAVEIGGKSDQTLASMDLTDGTPDHSAQENSISNDTQNLNCSEENEATNFEASVFTDLGGEQTHPTPNDASGTAAENGYQGSYSCQELAETCKKLNWRTGCKRSMEEPKEPTEFNPRGPNFLPVEPDPEAEKVDLKHQVMDERKNADEWMLDNAIQKAVNKLAPARKKKVALLVEAFETVMPVPRYETQQRHSSLPFSHARPIQACS